MADAKYRVKVDGLSYFPDPKKPKADQKERHAKAGQIVDDLPRVSIPWLLADGVIEKVGDE